MILPEYSYKNYYIILLLDQPRSPMVLREAKCIELVIKRVRPEVKFPVFNPKINMSNYI